MISAIVLAKNEEGDVVDCIDSLKWCGEIIVIDDNSDDNTAALAKREGAIVHTRSLDNDFAAQRNYGLEQAKGEWVLFVDADERVNRSLREEIERTIQNKEALDGYTLRRVDTMWGKELLYGETGNVVLLRLAKKEAGKWVHPVHETWKIRGVVGHLSTPLQHFPHPTISKFLQEINFYTDLRAKQLYKKGVKAPVWAIVLYPKAKFFLNYFIRRGYKDGTPGFLVAILMSFHSFLVRAKLWLLWQK